MLSASARFLLNRMNGVAQKAALGELLASAQGCLVVDYDVAVDGGSVGAKVLKTTGSLGEQINAVLPDKAIIEKVVIDIITAFTSTGNNGTLALHAQSAGDLLAAVDADTLSGRVAGIPDDAVANMIKLTAERNITATVATNALLTGKARIFIRYSLSA